MVAVGPDRPAQHRVDEATLGVPSSFLDAPEPFERQGVVGGETLPEIQARGVRIEEFEERLVAGVDPEDTLEGI